MLEDKEPSFMKFTAFQEHKENELSLKKFTTFREFESKTNLENKTSITLFDAQRHFFSQLRLFESIHNNPIQWKDNLKKGQNPNLKLNI